MKQNKLGITLVEVVCVMCILSILLIGMTKLLGDINNTFHKWQLNEAIIEEYLIFTKMLYDGITQIQRNNTKVYLYQEENNWLFISNTTQNIEMAYFMDVKEFSNQRRQHQLKYCEILVFEHTNYFLFKIISSNFTHSHIFPIKEGNFEALNLSCLHYKRTNML